MKVVLKYRREPRPRGSWRFPLWIKFGCYYTVAEVESLNPDWKFQQNYDFKLLEGHTVSLESKRRSKTANSCEFGSVISARKDHDALCYWHSDVTRVQIKIEDPFLHESHTEDPFLHESHTCVLSTTMHFSHSEDREAMIETLHEARDHLIVSAANWWKSQAPVAGDEEAVESVMTMDPVTGQIHDLTYTPETPKSVTHETGRRIRMHIGEPS